MLARAAVNLCSSPQLLRTVERGEAETFHLAAVPADTHTRRQTHLVVVCVIGQHAAYT